MVQLDGIKHDLWVIDPEQPSRAPCFCQKIWVIDEFWSTVDAINDDLWVIDPKQPSLAICFRQKI